VVNERKQKRLSREEEDFPRGSGRSLVNRKNISSRKRKRPIGEEEYFPHGSGREVMNRRNISSGKVEDT
jgi:hypothetical protein